MMGRIVILLILLCSITAGAVMFYLQVFAYYDEIDPSVANVQLVALDTGDSAAIMFENYKGIDSDSSPLRYRACFNVAKTTALNGTYMRYDEAVPLVAPYWFDCFDAEALGADLAAGATTAYLGQSNFRYGFDRVVAVYPDGRAYAWQQLNSCGRAVFGGNPAPDGCPPAPESF